MSRQRQGECERTLSAKEGRLHGAASMHECCMLRAALFRPQQKACQAVKQPVSGHVLLTASCLPNIKNQGL
jgi:hypothetical protein